MECFDEGRTFNKVNINNGRNVLIFGVHENSLVHANSLVHNIYIMGDLFVQVINDATLYVENVYSQNFTAANKKFVLSLHYNGDNSYLFVNGKQELKFKAKDDQIVKEILCLGNKNDDWTAVNAKKRDFGVKYMILLLIILVLIFVIYIMCMYLMKSIIYKMLLINLAISLFNVLNVNALECLYIINRECKPRPKILDVNKGVGEALFHPYNVLVNKCTGSCNTLHDPMARLCVPNIIKNVNKKVHNFLMRLNETGKALWHESCKCVCKLNLLVCNSKQIWNSDTCRSDCNEDFAGIMNCTKGYLWNPSTCACECDMWCKPGKYLDYKNCVCKNKLIGKIIAECTNVINETMMNNRDNEDNDDTIANIFIGLFSVLLFVGIFCFCVIVYFKWIKGKKLFKNKFTDY